MNFGFFMTDVRWEDEVAVDVGELASALEAGEEGASFWALIEVGDAIAHPQKCDRRQAIQIFGFAKPWDAILLSSQESSDGEEFRSMHCFCQFIDTVRQALEGHV